MSLLSCKCCCLAITSELSSYIMLSLWFSDSVSIGMISLGQHHICFQLVPLVVYLICEKSRLGLSGVSSGLTSDSIRIPFEGIWEISFNIPVAVSSINQLIIAEVY